MHDTGLILDAEKLVDLKSLSIKAKKANFHSLWATELYRTSFQQISVASYSINKIQPNNRFTYSNCSSLFY